MSISMVNPLSSPFNSKSVTKENRKPLVFLYKDAQTAELPAKTASLPEDTTVLMVNNDCLPEKRKDSPLSCVMAFTRIELNKLIKLLQLHS